MPVGTVVGWCKGEGTFKVQVVVPDGSWAPFSREVRCGAGWTAFSVPCEVQPLSKGRHKLRLASGNGTVWVDDVDVQYDYPLSRFLDVPVVRQPPDSWWCWAASLESILGYYGVDEPQRRIVDMGWGQGPCEERLGCRNHEPPDPLQGG